MPPSPPPLNPGQRAQDLAQDLAQDNAKGSDDNLGVIIGAAVGGIVIIMGLLAAYCFCARKGAGRATMLLTSVGDTQVHAVASPKTEVEVKRSSVRSPNFVGNEMVITGHMQEPPACSRTRRGT